MSAQQPLPAAGDGRGGRRPPCDPPTSTSTASFWHSEPSPLLLGHRSTRQLPTTADVVVIGSGMTGTSVAHHLLTTQAPTMTTAENAHGFDQSGKGRSVVMLEAREACWGATGRNGGHCAPIPSNPYDPSIGRFELANYHALQTLISTREIDCEFVAQPGVHAIYSNAALTDAELLLLTLKDTAPDLAQNLRLVRDVAELERLRIPTALGAVVSSVAARMWPYKFVARVLEDLLTSTELAGTFNLQTLTPVERIVSHDDGGDGKVGGWRVETPRGVIVASKVVLATNGYTSHLLPTFADLIVPCRGQMSALEPLPSVRGEDRLETSFGFKGKGMDDYLVQRPNERGGHLMFGGGRQNGRSLGVTDDSVINEPTAQYLRSRLLKAFDLPEAKEKMNHWALVCESCRGAKKKCIRLTALKPCERCRRLGHPCTNKPAILLETQTAKPSTKEFNATHEWTGIMGYSRDSHPWVGQIPGKPNLYIAAGYTGHGMPNTWLCGKAVALMIAAQPQGRIQEARLLHERKVDVEEVGLPACFLVTEERITAAMEAEDVEICDWAENERVRRLRIGSDRPHSGYA